MADEKNSPKTEAKAATVKAPDAPAAPSAPASKDHAFAFGSRGPNPSDGDKFKFLTHCGQFAKDAIATPKEILAAHQGADVDDLLARNVIKKHRIEE